MDTLIFLASIGLGLWIGAVILGVIFTAGIMVYHYRRARRMRTDRPR